MTAPTTPAFEVPAGAGDCHMHVFGLPDRFPLSAARTYTPRPAGLEAYRAMAGQLGLQRVVFVQPSPYGTDNRCMVDAMAAFGERARGIAVISDDTGEDELHALHAAGVRGLRVNIESFGGRSAADGRRILEATARRCRPLGWHIQLFAALGTIVELAPMLSDLEVPIVLDHFGMARAALGTQHPGFDSLLGLVASGVWVKLSGVYRISDQAPDYADATPLARALNAANPDRIVWGTDWPHTGSHAGHASTAPPVVEFRRIDDGRLLSWLGSWADRETLHRILVDNPAHLYDFV